MWWWRPDWPKRITEPFADPAVGLASGPSLVPDDINRIGRLAGLALSSRAAGYVAERYEQNRDISYEIDWDRVIGCNAVYRREAFAQMGGFPVDFYPGEEMIAAYRTETGRMETVVGARRMGEALSAAIAGSLLAADVGLWGDAHPAAAGGVSFTPMPLVPGLWVGATVLLALLSPFFAWAALAAGGRSGAVCSDGAGPDGGNGGADAPTGRLVALGHDSMDASRLWAGGMGRGIPPRPGFQRRKPLTPDCPLPAGGD